MSEEYKRCTKKYKIHTAFRFPKAIQDSWWLSIDYEDESDNSFQVNRSEPVEEYDDE